MQIADVAGALQKVREVLSLIDQEDGNPDDPWHLNQATHDQIQHRLPLVRLIAQRADPALLEQLWPSEYESPYRNIRKACIELVGILDSAEDAERILGPAGPQLAASNLHPWVWNAAVGLWDDGHRREAVQAAAQALFDFHLPAKLGVPARGSKDLVAQAFSLKSPTDTSPRLRLDDYPEGSQSWTSQHEGAGYLGMGCAQLIRNLATHVGTQPDEQTALEQLASLSQLARLIEQATRRVDDGSPITI